MKIEGILESRLEWFYPWWGNDLDKNDWEI